MSWFYWSGGAIIFVLAGVAIYLNWRVYQVRAKGRKQLEELEGKQRELRDRINNSVHIICRALQQGQVGHAEASLRICGLLDQLAVSYEQNPELKPVAKLADAIRHIPILDAWKALPKKEKRGYQILIEQKEAELGESIKESAVIILGKEY